MYLHTGNRYIGQVFCTLGKQERHHPRTGTDIQNPMRIPHVRPGAKEYAVRADRMRNALLLNAEAFETEWWYVHDRK